MIPDNSLARSEQEQSDAMSKRQKMSSEEQAEEPDKAEATSAIQEVNDYCFLLVDLSHSSHSSIAVFCTQRWTSNQFFGKVSI